MMARASHLILSAMTPGTKMTQLLRRVDQPRENMPPRQNGEGSSLGHYTNEQNASKKRMTDMV